jgi:hypothetical protein
MPSPQYLEFSGVPPPSQTPREKRASAEYRCERLIGLVNLYYWAMQWTVHREGKWKLGEKQYAFSLREKQLWLLDLETIEHVGEYVGDKRVYVHAQQATPPKRIGSFRLGGIRWGQYRRSVSAVGVAAEGDQVDHEAPEFVLGDRVLALDFPDDGLPWELITGTLRQAYSNAADILAAARIVSKRPPLFRHFVSGRELLKDTKVRGIRFAQVLQDLEERRREVVEDVEHLWRQQIKIPGLAGRTPVAESRRVKLFGPNDAPLIDGKPKSPLTKTRYDVVRLLIKAGPEGLTKDGLASEHGGAVNSLKALAEGDGDWKKVIKLAGKPGRRYRIE